MSPSFTTACSPGLMALTAPGENVVVHGPADVLSVTAPLAGSTAVTAPAIDASRVSISSIVTITRSPGFTAATTVGGNSVSTVVSPMASVMLPRVGSTAVTRP